jgi:phosphoribosylformylglycinamidine cyclo-ligase
MTSTHKSGLSYADAGVDIESGEALVQRIKPAAVATARPGVVGGLGGFGGLFDIAATGYRDPILVSSTDGVGTKLLLAIELGQHHDIGIDLVAMCVNDVVVAGAEPLYFLDYFATGALDLDTAEAVINSIARGCGEAGAALLGGETAEMPGMYPQRHYDLAGFCVGVVERGQVLDGTQVAEGDVILGLASSGVHSNGYSLVRKIVAHVGANYHDQFGEVTLGQALLTPTRIYVKNMLAALSRHPIHALAHITGGGLSENLPRVLPSGLGAEIDLGSWRLPPLFSWLRDAGDVEDAEMLRTFNCGIGMVVIAAPEDAALITDELRGAGEIVHQIGRVSEAASGVSYRGAWRTD